MKDKYIFCLFAMFVALLSTIYAVISMVLGQIFLSAFTSATACFMVILIIITIFFIEDD